MTKKTEIENTPALVTRTSAGLRDAIFDEIDSIRNGTSNPTRANAVAKLATGIVETVRMELEVEKHLRSANRRAPNDTARGPLDKQFQPMSLGMSYMLGTAQ